jgi:spore maturation protein CgeB
MRIVIFCHSLISDWNHGNAHFLRGIVAELIARSHDVVVYEPADAWSRLNLLAEAGPGAISRFQRAFPQLTATVFDTDRFPVERALGGADLVIVHEWNPRALVAAIGRHRARDGEYVLLFHDTHHRSVTDAGAMAKYDLRHYDGVLAFGDVIRRRYIAKGWARRAWTFHEAADTRVFTPLDGETRDGDVVWIGNWGDDERSAEIRSFLIEPVRDAGLRATVHGVRYPEEALAELARAGIRYGGWLPNYDAPRVYARHRMTVHIPRRPYVEALPGIPTIRVFEALACGIPLVSTGWEDAEGLFTPGEDFLVAKTPAEMRAHLTALHADPALRHHLIEHGLDTIRRRHTCAHRVDELLAIVGDVRGSAVGEVLSA